MTTSLNPAIVRIRAADGRVVGAGFLVGQRQVLTCAHVVVQALSLPDDAPELQKPGFSEKTRFLLDFPLVAPDQQLAARVVCWQPALPDGSGDVAGLELLDDPPTGASPIRLVKAEEPWGHPFRAFGFPAGYDNGVWASGRMLDREATGWVQIEDVKQTGYFIAPGFSGGPVWDEALDGVIGMTVAADSQGPPERRRLPAGAVRQPHIQPAEAGPLRRRGVWITEPPRGFGAFGVCQPMPRHVNRKGTDNGRLRPTALGAKDTSV